MILLRLTAALHRPVTQRTSPASCYGSGTVLLLHGFIYIGLHVYIYSAIFIKSRFRPYTHRGKPQAEPESDSANISLSCSAVVQCQVPHGDE